MAMRVEVESGKYTFWAKDGEAGVSVYRQGEPWWVCEQGSKAVLALMGELAAARERVAELERGGGSVPIAGGTSEPLRGSPSVLTGGGTYEPTPGSSGERWGGGAYAPGGGSGDRPRGEGRIVGQVAAGGVVTSAPWGGGGGFGAGGSGAVPQGSTVAGGGGLPPAPPRPAHDDSPGLPFERLRRAAAVARQLLDLAGACPVGESLRRQMADASWALGALGVESEAVEVRALDTLNVFAVTASEELVVSLGLGRRFTPEQALQLSSWLIVGAELAGYRDPMGRVMATVSAIEAV